MQVTNLKFSQEETAAIRESDFFLHKDSATKKIIEYFGILEKEIKNQIPRFNIDNRDINASSGKIFRGENYRLFPYIVLDYPRLFSKKSVFAFRTMFWWGHEFSFTLHLQGEALERSRHSLYGNFESLCGKNIFYCINSSPWQYDFGKDNYVLIDEIANRGEDILKKPFIKLSRKLLIEDSGKVHDCCLETFNFFMKALT